MGFHAFKIDKKPENEANVKPNPGSTSSVTNRYSRFDDQAGLEVVLEMKQRKTLSLFLLLGVQGLLLSGQSVQPDLLSTAGDVFTSPSSMLTFSVGETAVASHLTGPDWLTEGFQQPRLIVDAVPDEEVAQQDIQVTVWPNPFAEKLFLKVTGIQGRINASFIAMNGILISESDFINCEENCFIPTENLPAGTYFLLLSDAQGNRFGKWKIIRL
jgi:hypothetical protein